MIELIKDIVRFLSQNRLTVEDIVARVGSVASDSGGLMPIKLSPAIKGVRSANLARYPDSGLPYVLEIGFEADAQPKVKVLKSALGDYQRALTHRGRPIEILFYPSSPEVALWNVVLIAELASGEGEIEDTLVASIAFRRDPV